MHPPMSAKAPMAEILQRCASASHSCALCPCRFACRAKRVVNNAIVNEVLSDAAVLKRQAHEIEELKKRLAESG